MRGRRFTGPERAEVWNRIRGGESVAAIASSLGRYPSGPCLVKWCKRDRRHPRVVRLVHAAAVIAGSPSVSMLA
jgi:hypothetical protein